MLRIKVWLRRPQCVAGLASRVCGVSRYGLDDPSVLQVVQDEYARYQGMALDDPSVLQVVQYVYAKYQGMA